RCFTRQNSYTGCAVPTASPDGFYTIVASTLTATTYTLTATATGAQSKDKCSPFILDHRGEKKADSTTENCWG
ncbi:MAG: type IV pilin protein, partial [Wenzhouxiangella sp.]